jgi:hypothetical protein
MMRAPWAMVSPSRLCRARHDGGSALLEGSAIEDLRGRNHFARARTLCTGHRSMQRGRERRGDQHLPTPTKADMRKGSPRIPESQSLRISESQGFRV